MKKKQIIQISSIFAFVLALLLLVSNVLCYQCSADEARLKLFYNEEKNSLNLMLFGASSVRTDFIPTKAYENHGITSYNYCINAMPLPTTKYMIAEALQYQSPEIIVIDINGITYCNKQFTETQSVAFTETMKHSTNRNEALLDIYDGSRTWEDDISFIKYHKNIINLGQCINYASFYQNYGDNASILKGYSTYATTVEDFTNFNIINPNDITDFQTFNDYEIESINSLLDYCDSIKNDVKVVFSRFPRITTFNNNEWEIPYVNSFAKIIKDRGFDYIDFYNHMQDFDLNYSTDFSDFTHLNIFGAEKFTEYLCDYLKTNYNLTANCNNSKWDTCVEYANQFYEVIKKSTLKKEFIEFYEFDLAKKYNIFGV